LLRTAQPHGAPLEELKANLLEYRKCFVQGLLPVFEKDGNFEDSAEFEGHVSVCKEVLSFFRQYIEKTAHEPELQYRLPSYPECMLGIRPCDTPHWDVASWCMQGSAYGQPPQHRATAVLSHGCLESCGPPVWQCC
jgi:hypothetical protein